MTGSRPIAGFLLALSVALLIAGCESETMGPGPTEVEPLSSFGPGPANDNHHGYSPESIVSDGLTRHWDGSCLEVREHSLGTDLRPQDHTIIMEAVLHNIPEIVAQLPQNRASSGTEVLKAALRVPGIDPYARDRIRLVLEILPGLERARDRVPAETQRAMRDVLEGLEECETIAEAISALENMISSGEYNEHRGVPQAMGVCVQILHDGARTVYSPRYLFNLKRLAMQDLVGAIAGGITGAIAGGAGAVPGAIAGAAGSSAADAIGQATGWW
jgi:hypothetical protein